MQAIAQKVQRRLGWYKSRFQVNNPVVGRAVELFGDRVRMDGLVYSVATPQITRGHKSTLAFGLHEMEERELIRKWLPSDLPVIEFGGGLGVVSCLTNRKLSRPDRHVVLEANPAMIPVLEKNRAINGCKFHIINNAIAYGADYIDLNIDSEFVGSTAKAVSFGKTARVRTTNIKALMDQFEFDRAGIVCDIEGAEADVIDRELGPLGDRIAYIMAEMHPAILGEDMVARLMKDLESMGFALKEQIGDSVFLSR